MKKLFTVLVCLLMLCGCSTVIYEGSNSSADLNIKDSDKDASYADTTNLVLSDEDVYITSGGTYTLSGELKNASVIVNVSKDEEVQLVLDNIDINSGDFACIYIVEADKVTITLAEGSVNTLTDGSTYTQIDGNDIDAVIYSKADLTINGSGTLYVNGNYKHGIVSKDDLVITGGTYYVGSQGQGIYGKDCLKISDGTFHIECSGDALKSDNEEDAERGYVYIAGGSFDISTTGDAIYGLNLVSIEDGTFKITTTKSSSNTSQKVIKSDQLINISGGDFDLDTCDDAIHSDGDITISGGNFVIDSDDDAIHADALLTIEGGDFDITAHEGLEATYVKINDGTITITASDDGINAAQKVNTYTATFEMNGGYLKIDMGQGDTDAIDSNGYIYINGGTIEINSRFPFDYVSGAEYNGGTIIVNGTETDEISNQDFGNMGGQGMMPGANFDPGNAGSEGGTPPQMPGGSQGPWSQNS